MRAVQDSGLLGNLDAAQFRPSGAETDAQDEYIVKTHAGSDAERAAWARSLRD
jgi:hypothetical protein